MSEMWIKVNEVNEREKMINLAHVERISSDGVTGSIFWFGKDDVDSMYVKESFEDIERMMDIAARENVVVDMEMLRMNRAGRSVGAF